MSQRILLALAASAIASTLGYSGAAAQSAHPDFTVGAVVLRPRVGAELQDALITRQAPPQQVERHRTRGAIWGGGIGLVAGGLLGGLTVDSDDEGGFGGSLAESAATGEAVLLGAVVGAGIGALLGATVFAPSQRSASADGRALTLSVRPSGSVIAVSGRVRVGR